MTTTNVSEKLVTATDLLNLPDDGYKYELVDGHLVRDSLPGQGHGTVVAKLTHLLMTWALRERAGTVSAGDPGFHLRSDPDTVRGPDVAFFSGSRYCDAGRPAGYWQGAPDLAVEIVSPSDRMVDVLDKVRDYLDAAAQQAWVVVPQSRTLTIHESLHDVHVLTAEDTLAGTPPVEGFQLRVAELFD